MKSNLIDNIDKLIKGTISGKIMWTKPSENVFVWQTTNSDKSRLNVILQGHRVAGSQVLDITFRLFELETKNSLIDVKTEDTSHENRSKIFELFQTIKDNSDEGRVDILSDLLKDI